MNNTPKKPTFFLTNKSKLLKSHEVANIMACCNTDIDDIESLLDERWTKTVNPSGLKHFFLDRGSKILAVAHLDTVMENKKFHHRIMDNGYERIESPSLDDRLGLWVLLFHLYDLGYDILLTEGEETGDSTAQFFNEKGGRNYNWMFSFDRKGMDVVCYQYDSPELTKKLEDSGFKVAIGSFSDITYLERLGIKGMNFGVGYHNNHSDDAYALVHETLIMTGKFREFFEKYKEQKMWHRNGNYADWRFYENKQKKTNWIKTSDGWRAA